MLSHATFLALEVTTTLTNLRIWKYHLKSSKARKFLRNFLAFKAPEFSYSGECPSDSLLLVGPGQDLGRRPRMRVPALTISTAEQAGKAEAYPEG